MGWNDVSFHGSDQIPTPNIDAIGYNGVILNQHYTMAMCTPSRAALLTGKYPIRTGMQHYVLRESEPRGLRLNETLLPQYLSQAGYECHMIGKWHLGMHLKEETPTFRGFKSHYGLWQGYHDFYTHFVDQGDPPFIGYDMRRNLNVDWDSYGKYSTDLFSQEAIKIIKNHNKTKPLFMYLSHVAPHAGNLRSAGQAPQYLINKYKYIKDPDRRIYAAVMHKLDKSIGDLMSALKQRKMLQNSVVIFMGDNGAPTIGYLKNSGSNYPLRGLKATAWEGAHRGVAAVWSPLINKQNRVSNILMHITDWLPTLLSLAGMDVKNLNIDGIDMWKAISNGGISPREDMLYNIDDVESPYAAYRSGYWKYIVGYHSRSTKFNDWYGNFSSEIKFDANSVLVSKAGLAITNTIIKKSLNNMFDTKDKLNDKLLNIEMIKNMRRQAKIKCNNQEIIPCNPAISPCLFNLRDDPCEKVNLASMHKNILKKLEISLNRYRSFMVKAQNTEPDCRANPSFWNDTWTYWVTELNDKNQSLSCHF